MPESREGRERIDEIIQREAEATDPVQKGMFTGQEIRGLVQSALRLWTDKYIGVLHYRVVLHPHDGHTDWLTKLHEETRREPEFMGNIDWAKVEKMDDVDTNWRLGFNWAKISPQTKVKLATAALKSLKPTGNPDKSINIASSDWYGRDPRCDDPQGYFAALLNSESNVDKSEGWKRKSLFGLVAPRAQYPNLELSPYDAEQLASECTKVLESLELNPDRVSAILKSNHGVDSDSTGAVQGFLRWQREIIGPAIQVLQDWGEKQ